MRRYYSGRADATGFQVSDLVLEGRTAEALSRLRWALSTGVDPVPLVAALAIGLRSLAAVASAPRGLRPAELASHLGMPDWKIRNVRAQLPGWRPDGVAAAISAVAEADAEVKGGGSDPAYAVERAVLRIAEARGLWPASPTPGSRTFHRRRSRLAVRHAGLWACVRGG